MSVVVCPKCGTKNRVNPEAAANKVARCGKCGTPLDASSQSTTPFILADGNFQQEVAASGSVPLLVDVWAPWCGPCRVVGPIMEQLARESDGRYRIAKLNVDENPQTGARFQISSIPTMLIFKNGQLVDRLVGALPKDAIASRLAQWT